MTPRALAGTCIRELLKSQGTGEVNSFLGQCSTRGVSAAITALFAAGPVPAAMTVLSTAAMLVGPVLWEHHTDTKRRQEFLDAVAEVREALALAANDLDKASRQLTEIAERRRFVWARLSGSTCAAGTNTNNATSIVAKIRH